MNVNPRQTPSSAGCITEHDHNLDIEGLKTDLIAVHQGLLSHIKDIEKELGMYSSEPRLSLRLEKLETEVDVLKHSRPASKNPARAALHAHLDAVLDAHVVAPATVHKFFRGLERE